MAASALTPTQITRAGIVDTLSAANVDGNYFANTGREWIEVLNGSGGSINVIFAGVTDGITVATLKTIAVAAGVRKKIGPFPSTPYSDADGRVQVTYSAVTTVTVGVFYV
jgi:hypothetical protein